MAVLPTTMGRHTMLQLLIVCLLRSVTSFTMSPPTGQRKASELPQTPVGVTAESSVSLSSSITALPHLPQLIVFDLDNTLWSPELYQIRKRSPPVVNQDIRLFPDALEILQLWYQLSQSNQLSNVRLAIASRTSKKEWADMLLDAFEIEPGVSLRSLFDFIEIQTGSKKQHLARLRDQSGASYSSMLFFDDDARMNLDECSQLGVLSCHTPTGMTCEYFTKALTKYSELKLGHDENHWMGYILNADNLGIIEPTVELGQRCRGRVKFFSPAKRFGFVIDLATGQECFVHESKVPMGMTLQTGDIVSFEANMDSQGRASAVILAEEMTNGVSVTATRNEEMVTMPCFTMSQPFAALLLNGVKTVESRNNPMFMDVQPGTRVLLHCGRKDWHDQESYLDILDSKGLSRKEIEKKSKLPKKFTKGSIIGIMTVGKTRRTSEHERRDADLQERVLAPFEGIGKFCTEVLDAQWLKRPIKTRGNPGIYTVDVPKDTIP